MLVPAKHDNSEQKNAIDYMTIEVLESRSNITRARNHSSRYRFPQAKEKANVNVRTHMHIHAKEPNSS